MEDFYYSCHLDFGYIIVNLWERRFLVIKFPDLVVFIIKSSQGVSLSAVLGNVLWQRFSIRIKEQQKMVLRDVNACHSVHSFEYYLYTG